MKKIFTYFFVSITVFSLLGATLAFPTTVYADSGAGKGTLKASGSGYARVTGNGTITISGIGTLFIKDYHGDATITVTGKGRKVNLPDGWVQYVGYNGTAIITGRSVSVSLIGVRIRLVATGIGRFVLKGRGIYKTGHLSGNWWQDNHEMEIQ